MRTAAWKLFIGERNVLPDRFDSNRKCLAIQVADGDRGADENGDAPPQSGSSRSESDKTNAKGDYTQAEQKTFTPFPRSDTIPRCGPPFARWPEYARGNRDTGFRRGDCCA